MVIISLMKTSIHFFKPYYFCKRYEPELNPGVTYRIKEFKATLKIYSTGSITVNGKEILKEISKIKL